MSAANLAAAVALAAPLCLVTASLAAIALVEPAGGTLFGAHAPANLAEAAGMGRADLVVRLLGEGQRPGQVYPLHPDVISSTVLRATALEAAIWSRRLPLIELLDREGAIPAGERHALACLAADVGEDDMVEYLAPEGTADCEHGAAMRRVLDRTPRQP